MDTRKDFVQNRFPVCLELRCGFVHFFRLRILLRITCNKSTSKVRSTIQFWSRELSQLFLRDSLLIYGAILYYEVTCIVSIQNRCAGFWMEGLRVALPQEYALAIARALCVRTFAPRAELSPVGRAFGMTIPPGHGAAHNNLILNPLNSLGNCGVCHVQFEWFPWKNSRQPFIFQIIKQVSVIRNYSSIWKFSSPIGWSLLSLKYWDVYTRNNSKYSECK